MWLHDVANALPGARLKGDAEFSAVSTDSRNVPAGALFIALRGPRFDGHSFAQKALEAGAAAVLIDAQSGLDVSPSVTVPDTRIALGQLAAWHRQQCAAKVLAVTGSNGKTTVKEMCAAILRQHAGDAAALVTAGNFNNDIGMPLTLLKLQPTQPYAVLEMGMNHPGELDYLTKLAVPDVALVNNAQRAHLEGLNTLEAVARAKGEIFNGLKPDGIAIYNADDSNAALWAGLCQGRKTLTFGLTHGDVRADYALQPFGALLKLHTPAGAAEIQLQVPGRHNVSNAVAAAAVTFALGVPLSAIAAGLAGFTGVKGRLQAHECLLGARLIDDTYNANPDSVSAAIDVLASQPGTRILVLGDMGELGPGAAELHREIGSKAQQAGIDRLLALGEISEEAVKAFGDKGMFFERIEELLAEIEQALGPDVTLLVKGSRFMKMERVVQSFEEKKICS